MPDRGLRVGLAERLGTLGYGAPNLGNLHRAMTDDEAWSVLETAWAASLWEALRREGLVA